MHVGKQEQCINLVDNSLRSLIDAKIEYYFDFIICTYPDNKEGTLSVPCNARFLLIIQ